MQHACVGPWFNVRHLYEMSYMFFVSLGMDGAIIA